MTTATSSLLDAAALEHRLGIIEGTLLGAPPPQNSVENFLLRVERLRQKMNEIEASIPNLKTNRDLAKKIGCLLSSTSVSLNDATAKISVISSSREEHDNTLSNLLTIKDLSVHARGGDLEDYLLRSNDLDLLERRVSSCAAIISQETKEVDALLDRYEQAINLLSLKCAEWDGALLLLEEKMS